MIGIERRNTKTWHRINAILRLAVLRGATRPFAENVVVNEYPKSGGTWLSQMLAAALDLPFPRNRLPMIKSCLMQCHVLHPAGMRNVVVVWRDGRDVAVSFYHHMLIGHEYATREMSQETARYLGIRDPHDIRSNLPVFLEALFEKRIGPSFTWSEFVEMWHGRKGIVETRYEDLLENTARELIRTVNELDLGPLPPERAGEIVSAYSFEGQTGRGRGEAGAGQFLRKGVAGDWVNHFTPEALAVFYAHAGEALDALGYVRGAGNENA